MKRELVALSVIAGAAVALAAIVWLDARQSRRVNGHASDGGRYLAVALVSGLFLSAVVGIVVVYRIVRHALQAAYHAAPSEIELAVAIALIAIAGLNAFLALRAFHRCPKCERWGLRRVSAVTMVCKHCNHQVRRGQIDCSTDVP